MPEVVIYETQKAPVTGLKSGYFASRVQPGSGGFKQLQNVRWADDDLITMRAGIPAALSSAVGVDGIWRGLFTCVFNNGAGTLFASTKDSSNKTHLWRADNGTVWTELTAASGKYGDTTMAADSGNDYETAWAVFHDKYMGKDFVVAQNGFDFPRITNGTQTVKVEPVPLPTVTTGLRVWWAWRENIPFNNPAKFTVSGAAAGGVVLTDSGVVAPNDYLKLVINAAATMDSDYVGIATPVHWENAKQIHFVVEGNATAVGQLVQGVKVQVRDTAGAPATKSLYEPYDATIAGSDVFPVPSVTQIPGVPNWQVVSYVVPLNNWITAAVDRIIFTWAQATASGASFEVDILSAAASNYSVGGVYGRAECALTYYNSGSLAESAEFVMPNTYQLIQALGTRLTTIGTGVSISGVRIPNGSGTEALAYTERVYYANATVAQRDKGVDSCRFYRREFGEDVYRFSGGVTYATWGGATWAFSSGAAGDILSNDNGTQSGDRLFWLLSPGAFNLPIPIGRAMFSANGRLGVGARAKDGSGTTYDAFQRVSISRRLIPTRFSEVTDELDPDSAAEERLPGENVQAFIAAAGDLVGSATVYAFTDNSVYIVATHAPNSALFLTRVSTIGTASPNSVVEREGRVYFVDLGMRVRRLSANGPEWISQDVDDKFQGIPAAYRRKIVAMWHKDRVYFAYTPTGGTANTRIVIFSEKAGAWESDDLLPSQQADFMVRWVGASGTYATFQDARILYVNSSDRKCYRYESGTTDLAASIALVITTGDASDGMWRGFTCSRWGIMCSAVSATLAGTLSFKPKTVAGISGGSAVLSASNTYDWMYSTKFKSTSASAQGNAMSISITGSLPGATTINALCLDMKESQTAPRGT